ncbi:MAG: HlyD family efflux transporter periplasmic adaptor subunit [Anaerolineae bacterium]|nr:HlyD family efflux transporter periplasmic adaptor subunit [Anaerolineae bacterium]
MKPKKLLWIIGGLVVLGGLLCLLSSFFPDILPQGMAAATPTVTATAQVEMAVRARGKVEPAEWNTLAFDTNGSVAAWVVEEGTIVHAGDLLGQLDTAKLELALQQARLELEKAKLRLTEAEKELAQQQAEAELALQTAEVRLAQTRARPPSITAASVRLESARRAEASALDEYNKSLDRLWEEGDKRKEYREVLQQAMGDRQIAEAELATAQAEQAANVQEIAELQIEIAKSKLKLEQLAEGIDPTLAQDVAAAELKITQAEADLAETMLVAPFDGTVMELHYQEGDWVQSGAEAVTLADLTTLRIETTDLDEWGAAQIQVGDEARITFTAFDDKTLSGHVTEIATRGEALSGGDVVYRTLIELDAPDPELRWGMTVRVTIPLEDAP